MITPLQRILTSMNITIAVNRYMKTFLIAALAVLAISCGPTDSPANTSKAPDSSRYAKTVLAQGLDEPLQMAVLPNNNVVIVERKGAVKLYNAQAKQTKTIASLNVYYGIEDGLLGVVADPGFKNNHWIYLYYAPA